MDTPTPEEIENFHIYALSVTTSMTQSPHKVIGVTTNILTEMTTQFDQILNSPAKTDPTVAVESLLSNEWWKTLQNSLRLHEEETPGTFWIKGDAWTPIDYALSERRNEHDFGKDKPSRSRRILGELGAVAVVAIKDKLAFHFLMFECSQKASADIVSKCVAIRELKQGSLMIKTCTLPLTHA